MTERWLTYEEARNAVKDRLQTSFGRAQAVLADAKASREVRFYNPACPPLLLADDGLLVNGRGDRFIYGIDAEGRPTTHRISQDPQALLSISEDDLLDWLNRNHGPAAIAEKPLRLASEQEIRAAMLAVASDPANDRPNVKQLAKLVVVRLRDAGAIVSENQVVTLADAPEFKALRRPPGKTKRSGG